MMSRIFSKVLIGNKKNGKSTKTENKNFSILCILLPVYFAIKKHTVDVFQHRRTLKKKLLCLSYKRMTTVTFHLIKIKLIKNV
jgi:hypothetical protein